MNFLQHNKPYLNLVGCVTVSYIFHEQLQTIYQKILKPHTRIVLIKLVHLVQNYNLQCWQCMHQFRMEAIVHRLLYSALALRLTHASQPIPISSVNIYAILLIISSTVPTADGFAHLRHQRGPEPSLSATIGQLRWVVPAATIMRFLGWNQGLCL